MKLRIKVDSPEMAALFTQAKRDCATITYLMNSADINPATASIAMLMLAASNSKKSGHVPKDEYMQLCEYFWDNTLCAVNQNPEGVA